MLLQLDRICYTPPNFTRPLLTDISFALAAGEIITVTGITGAGKSTLLRLLNRLSEPTNGQILLNGENYRSLVPMRLRQRVMLVSQEPKLLGMKVRDTLAYPLQLQSIAADEIKQRIITIAEQFEILNDWFDRTELQLSVGQRQIIAIARGLITQPQILLLDEPIANLDFTTAEKVLTAIANITKSQQMGTIIVNHQLELAARFSDRLLYLQDGKLLLDKLSSSVDWQNLQQQIRAAETESMAEWE
ncbi:ABC transporter ATP-binding protein [Chamaesiphon minutus]|uniref:ABC-type metal ion transport system, ATPase component n=1 Tax=Chamaesiphon minutus (strain ATCC 27169 / PCC 6605) TaxID=1173020 RepID=K9UIZ9_CHAP6|nr:ATP-binding cassette domain-containing protein [Chamaesiphon minutus]AFY95092.1 ABC-type metal ion transport system, ATPase component [Chamaesiphon minutus PCC 6605]